MPFINTARTNLRKLAGKVTLWFAFNVILLVGLLGIEFSPLSKPHWWEDVYSMAMNVVAGCLVPFFFYWLVVYFPEQRKRHIIKDNLSHMYRTFSTKLFVRA